MDERQSQTNPLIGLPYLELIEITGRDPLIYHVRHTAEVRCPKCDGKRLRHKDTSLRRVRHVSVGLKSCWLEFEVRKFKCLSCNKYFREPIPGILPYQHSTEAFREEVAAKHQAGIMQKTLSVMLKIGVATVERYYHHFNERKVAEIKNDPAPLILGVDEHFFTKKKAMPRASQT